MTNIKYILVLFLVTVLTALAGSPSATLLKTETVTLGAGSSDTLTISNVAIIGDSIGVSVEYDKDSISGELRYQYLSYNGKTDTTQFSNLPVLLTLPIRSYAGFSEAVPIIAGVYKLQYYLITKNNASTVQTININVYSVSSR